MWRTNRTAHPGGQFCCPEPQAMDRYLGAQLKEVSRSAGGLGDPRAYRMGKHNGKYPFQKQSLTVPQLGFPGGSAVRICLQCRRAGFHAWVRRICWRRDWQSTPIFLPGEFHGQRSLVGYRLRGCKHCSWHATSINKYELLMIVLLF